MNKEVIVYGRVTPVCPFCVQLKAVFDSKGINYVYKDIMADPKAMEEFQSKRLRTVPAVFVDGVFHGGFDKVQDTVKVILKGEEEEQVETPLIRVKKRDGRMDTLDLDKIHQVVEWAAEGLQDVSVSQVELKSHIQFYDGIESDVIHSTLVKSAADLISKESPDYQYFAARLLMFQLRKKAYGTFTPPHLEAHVSKLTNSGHYDKHILEDYNSFEMDELNTYVDHKRDLNFAYAAAKQLEGKYLVQDRTNGKIFESPQYLYMLVGMCLFSKYEKNVRLDFVKRFYDAVSQFKLSLPTPIMAGVRTPTRQFSSCVLIESGDSLDSINASASAIVKYVSQRAGIGINAGRIRALGSPIRNGEAEHTGVIPFYKHFQTAVKSCSQGGVRGGAATLFYPMWHLEVENLLVLKNNRGIDENRVRHLDYGVQFNKVMYERLIKNQNITLFCPNDVEGLYDAYFEDQDKFKELYEAAEANPDIRKTVIPAKELFSSFAQERAGSGRIYLQNVDHCNTNSPFISTVAPIRQSNLCLEIALPTKPLENILDENGEVALCTLSALNLGVITSLDDLDESAELGIRALDALLDYQDYPIAAARISSMNRRTLGMGIINYANWIAKQGFKYSDGSANNTTHEMMERFQYALLKASNKLAKEKGACPSFHETTYSQGIMPIDRYKKEIDKHHSAELLCDWDSLREDIVKYGLRNSTVSALMPSETSSQISNATNGIEPPRAPVVAKASKDGVMKQVVPDYAYLKNNYEYVWDMPDNRGYLTLVGIMQKFVCQAISANTNYKPENYVGGKVPVMTILQDQLYAYKIGLKTFYYHNTYDGADDTQGEVNIEEDADCAGGGCKI